MDREAREGDFFLTAYDLDHAIIDIRRRGMADALRHNALVQEAMQPNQYPHLINRMVHHHIHDTPLLHNLGNHDEAHALDDYFFLVKYPHNVEQNTAEQNERASQNTPLTVQAYDRTGRVRAIDRERTHEYTDDLVNKFMSEWRAYGKDEIVKKIHDKKIGRYVDFASDRLANLPATDNNLQDLWYYGRF